MMIRFGCDYQEGCHPRILERLAETNMEQTPGYGLDPHCERAKELIRKAVRFIFLWAGPRRTPSSSSPS